MYVARRRQPIVLAPEEVDWRVDVAVVVGGCAQICAMHHIFLVLFGNLSISAHVLLGIVIHVLHFQTTCHLGGKAISDVKFSVYEGSVKRLRLKSGNSNLSPVEEVPCR